MTGGNGLPQANRPYVRAPEAFRIADLGCSLSNPYPEPAHFIQAERLDAKA